MNNVWEDVLTQIKTRMNPSSFHAWFAPTKQTAFHDRELWIGVPDQYFANWLEEHYLDGILDTLKQITGKTIAVHFVVQENLPRPKEVFPDVPSSPPLPVHDVAAPEKRAPRPLTGAEEETGLNPKYTFETYVVGTSNQLAHAASQAVAKQLSTAYNPLFIYGGVGLGKTHLMHALGHAVRASQPPGFKLYYLSSEKFMNELINAIRYDTTQQFRDKYRSIDLLLIDDIQFIAGKERTQEEFFHTFNTLYNAQKQVVISSDCPPKKIPTLEERLRSRFEWGLIVDIQPPDLETKIAILRKKAETERIALPDDVAMFIATAITSNIRALEGCLLKIAAHATLSQEQITVELASRALKDILDPRTTPEKPSITVERIQHVVANYYHLKFDDMKSATRLRPIAFPRQIAMFLARKLTNLSLPAVGQYFGGKDHTTILHACQKIEELQHNDLMLREELVKLEQAITSVSTASSE